MRLSTSLIAITVLALIVAAGLLKVASGRTRSANRAQAAAAALFEFQSQWTTHGSGVVFSRNRWPASLKALQMNSVEVSKISAGASKREDGPLGIWWSEGYQIQRQKTNDNTWTLYRIHAFGLPGKKLFRWRSVLTAVTNAP